jgi:phage/plasmid-associated DNA primase
MWTGKRFEKDLSTGSSRVRYIIMHQLSTVYRRLRDELETKRDEATDEKEEAELASLLKSLKSFNTAHEVGETMKVMQGEMFRDLAKELDGDPDILNVQNGVVDLRTGQLDIHRPAYLCTMLADVDYKVRL